MAELAVLPLDPTQAQAIVNAARAMTKLSRVGDAKRTHEMKLARAAKSGEEETFIDSDCISQSDDTVTYTRCELKSGKLVRGTVSSNGDALTPDLRAVLLPASQEEYNVTTSMDGTITVTDVLLNGTLRYEEDLNDGVQLHRVDADYAVTLDSAGCPVGGQLSFDHQCEGCDKVSVVATFGPSCGDVTLR